MRNEQPWIDTYSDKRSRSADFMAEEIAIGLIEEALKMMAEEGMTQAEMARAMQVKPAYVSRIFNAPPNMTLRTMCQLAIALNTKPHASLRPRCPPLLVDSEPQMLLRIFPSSGRATGAVIGSGAERPGSYRLPAFEAEASLAK